jgi:hypothetical protein
MAENSVGDSGEYVVVEPKRGRRARTTVTPAEKLLLQQHQLLLVRAVVSRTTYRAISTVIAVLAVVSLIVSIRIVSVSAASVCLASLVAVLWYFEQLVLDTHLGTVEKNLAKRGANHFEDLYIHYRYEATNTNLRYHALRYEPLYWLAVIIVIALINLMTRRFG